MRTQGLSRSRMNQAKAHYSPFFRWLKRNRVIRTNPMTDFQLPTSTQLNHERVPPELEKLALLLRTAAELVPEIAPALALGAVTGMRSGELVGLRRDRMFPGDGVLLIDSAIDDARVKSTKTRRERRVVIDADTMEMLVEHCAEMDRRAESVGTTVNAEGFVFSTAVDCSTPMSPDFLTRGAARLKGHLGIENKQPATIALEDEALHLRWEGSLTHTANRRPGPSPTGAMSYSDIGNALDRSQNWAIKAVACAKRREAQSQSPVPQFDGSILALRKFTSSELLDAGFNISAVAQRQGHSPQVLVKHYSKLRHSADRRAAEQLGRVVNQARAQGTS